MKKHIKLVITCLVLLVCVNLNAQYKYAAPDGLSTNTGEIDSPYDLQTALSTLLPGETLWLRGGDYTETGTYVTNGAHGTAGHPITISSYPGEWARINGNVICTNIVGADDPDELEEGEEPDPGSVQCRPILNVNRHYYIFKNFEITMISDDDPSTIEDNFSRYRGNYTTTVANPSSNPETYPLINRSGISHTNGINCKFINLIIRNLGGNGIGSWRATGGAEIYSCLIYNNGDQAIDEGDPATHPISGSGIYMQNQTNLWKNINNNIFFNNFKVGAKLWSASNFAPHVDFLKNVNFNNNVVLNTGSPLSSAVGKECFIAAGASQIEGEGVVHDVNIKRNFMYHNSSAGAGYAAVEVLLIGTEQAGEDDFGDNMFYNEVHNVNVLDNYLIGNKQGLRLVRVRDIAFKRNIVKSNYMFSIQNTNTPWCVGPSSINTMTSTSWDFDENNYFSKNGPVGDLFLVQRIGDPNTHGQSRKRKLDQVRGVLSHCTDEHLDFESANSTNYNTSGFFNHLPLIISNNNNNDYTPTNDDNANIISITQNKHKPNEFKIVVFDYNGIDVKVNLKDYSIPDGLPYTIRDVENYFTTLDDPSNFGNIFNGNTHTIVVPMSLSDIDVPNGHYPAKDDWGVVPRKSDPQVGVFIVEFDVEECQLQYVLQGFTEDEDKLYLAEDNIITGEHPDTELQYIVDGNTKVTYKAGTNIIFKAGTHIKARDDEDHPVLAQIEPCSSSNSGLEYVGEDYLNPETRKSMTQSKVNEKVIYSIKVAPNPATTKIAISSSEKMSHMKLTNTLGRTFLEMNVNQNSTKNAELDLSNVPSGLYFLQVTLTNGDIVTKQVIKK